MNAEMFELVQGGASELDHLAKSGTNVLIRGERGSKLASIARYLHERSSRLAGPFVQVSLNRVPTELLEGVLYGHERGAFTGVARVKHGCFEMARTGTLLLDEIASIPKQLQDAIGKMISEGLMPRIGGATPVRIDDLRIIATTEHDLERDVREGNFSRKLHDLLSPGKVYVTPLRERKDVIRRLAWLRLSALQAGEMTFTDAAIERLGFESWPGNVEELERVVMYATVDALFYQKSPQIRLKHVTAAFERIAELAARLTRDRPKHTQEEVARCLIEATVEKTGSVPAALSELNAADWMAERIKPRHAH